ncbi:MAG: HlyD family secretion protein [Deltaproteobacteria bacterium]|jgi:membrane fusion protein (multidrug efflux system)|nr:HlyD family secretion protein [Deltaproteobacteria bacterium]MCL5880063.1 HlyD family secretion protein [Deltaproteobacteria bacterium]MDA8304502.1 HlyD family secretion protein [Deltaproteobacteria bacterium]
MNGDNEKIGGSGNGGVSEGNSKFTKKNIITASIILLLAIIGGIFVLRWYLFGLTHVYTEDAEVDGHIVSVSTQVPGNITAIYVYKNEHVKKGELIARISDSTYYPAMLQARANYKLAKAKLFSAGAGIGQFIGTNYNSYYLSKLAYRTALANLRKAKLTYELNKRDYARDLILFKKEFITKQQFDSVKTAYLVSKQAYIAAISSLGTAKRNYFQSSYMKSNVAANNLTTLKPLEANVKIAKAAYKTTLANYKNTFIHSPINGVITEKMSFIGEYITPGTPIVMENNPKRVWVTANVKETVIGNIKKGDPVVITVDSFPGKTFKGVVKFVGSVSTSKFALIPTNNPSGTFTKVTHRLPVRIKVLNDKNHILKPGMMVEVTINTAKR